MRGHSFAQILAPHNTGELLYWHIQEAHSAVAAEAIPSIESAAWGASGICAELAESWACRVAFPTEEEVPAGWKAGDVCEGDKGPLLL